MAKLPERHKVSLLLFRRSNPDEIFVVQREAKRTLRWALPSDEARPSEAARDAAIRVAGELARGPPLGVLDVGIDAAYRVNSGPRAGEWKEKFFAVEVAPDCRASGGRWMPHYDAKVHAGEDAPRVRDAISRLREMARLKP